MLWSVSHSLFEFFVLFFPFMPCIFIKFFHFFWSFLVSLCFLLGHISSTHSVFFYVNFHLFSFSFHIASFLIGLSDSFTHQYQLINLQKLQKKIRKKITKIVKLPSFILQMSVKVLHHSFCLNVSIVHIFWPNRSCEHVPTHKLLWECIKTSLLITEFLFWPLFGMPSCSLDLVCDVATPWITLTVVGTSKYWQDSANQKSVFWKIW